MVWYGRSRNQNPVPYHLATPHRDRLLARVGRRWRGCLRRGRRTRAKVSAMRQGSNTLRRERLASRFIWELNGIPIRSRP